MNASKLLDRFDAGVRAEARDKLRYRYAFEGNSVTLFECRPHFANPSAWGELAVARFRRIARTGLWHLYCCDRNNRWRRYEDAMPTRSLAALVAEVQRDPTGIFFG